MTEELTLDEYLQLEEVQKAQERTRNARNRQLGQWGEDEVARELERRGLLMVEKIEVGWGISRDAHGRISKAWPLAKVSGDYRAITPQGQSVLVEVKSIDDRLQFSRIRPHQRQALDTHTNCGGLSLLAWVHDGHVSIMWWPVEGFVKGTSLKAEQARQNEWEWLD